jgi:diadenylate cyclase
VTLFDVSGVLQRSSIVQKTEKEVKKYIYELGADGRLLSMQTEELMANVSSDLENVINDYRNPDIKSDAGQMKEKINQLSADELMDLNRIANILGYKTEGNLKESSLHPRGYRILSEIRRLPHSIIVNLIEKFGSLKAILDANEDELSEVAGMGKVRAGSIYDRLKKYSEYYLFNKSYNRGGL